MLLGAGIRVGSEGVVVGVNQSLAKSLLGLRAGHGAKCVWMCGLGACGWWCVVFQGRGGGSTVQGCEVWWPSFLPCHFLFPRSNKAARVRLALRYSLISLSQPPPHHPKLNHLHLSPSPTTRPLDFPLGLLEEGAGNRTADLLG